MTIIADSRWYVVQTHVHAERKAASHLVRQGFSIYLPRYLKRRRHARRVETVEAPLFPRYLFVAIDQMTQRWRAIQSTIGVTHLVRNGDEPAAVPAAVVAALRGREDERGLIHLIRPRFRPVTKFVSWTVRSLLVSVFSRYGGSRARGDPARSSRP
jgi:transcriptional antiterminator RfaH